MSKLLYVNLTRDAPGGNDWTLQVGDETHHLKSRHVRALLRYIAGAQPGEIRLGNKIVDLDRVQLSILQDYFSMFQKV